MVFPCFGDEPDSCAPLRRRKYLVDDCCRIGVARKVANRGPDLTIEGARKVVLFYPLFVLVQLTITLSGYRGDKLFFNTEVHLQELILVIVLSRPCVSSSVHCNVVEASSIVAPPCSIATR